MKYELLVIIEDDLVDTATARQSEAFWLAELSGYLPRMAVGRITIRPTGRPAPEVSG